MQTMSVHRMLLELPVRLEAERLFLRPYGPGDGRWYYSMSQRNRRHLERFEAGNAVMFIQSEEDAEVTVREFAATWAARKAFFLGAFRREGGEFVAQVYVGVVNWDLPEFEVGYFADVDHEGQGYVTEAVRAALHFIFEHLGARRVSLRCDETNTRSQRVAERCGFVLEGHTREDKLWPGGTCTDTLHYGLLPREFTGLV